MDSLKKSLILKISDESSKIHNLPSSKEVSFKYIGNMAAGESLRGNFGMLIDDKETLLYEKTIKSNLLPSILTSSVVSSMYSVYLLKGCHATDYELDEFQHGMREAYSEITINNERVFDDDKIEKNMELYLYYLRSYLEDWENEHEGKYLFTGQSKASDWIVTTLFNYYHLEDELSEIEMMIEQQKVGHRISLFSVSLLEIISPTIKRNI